MFRFYCILVCLFLGATVSFSLVQKPEILPRLGLVKYQTAVSVLSANATYLCFDFGADPDCGSGGCSVASNKLDGTSGRIALRAKDLRVVACTAGEKSEIATTAYSFDYEELPIGCPVDVVARGGFAGDSIVLTLDPYYGELNHFVRLPTGAWFNDRTDVNSGFEIASLAHGPHITVMGDPQQSLLIVLNHASNTTHRLQGPTKTLLGWSIDLSPAEDFVVASTAQSGGGKVQVFDTATWQNETLPFPNCTGSTKIKIGESVATDGTRIIVGCPESGTGGLGFAAIYSKNNQGQWIVEQCLIANASVGFGGVVHISGEYVLVSDGINEVGRVNVFHREEQLWTLRTQLYGWKEADDLTPSFGGFGARWTNGHVVVVRTHSTTTLWRGYVHTFAEAENWNEHVFTHSSPTGNSVSVSGDFLLTGCTIFPTDAFTAQNVVTQILPVTVERDHEVVLHHAIGANVSCKFFRSSDRNYPMTDAFTLNMGATLTTVRVPSAAGTYWLRCRAPQSTDAARQSDTVVTVTDACLAHPCKNGATCVNSVKSPTDYTCSCANEYWGDTCESHSCLTHQCENGATCVLVPTNVTQYTCACAANFWGSRCEKFGYAPQSSSSTGSFVPQPNVITVRITMLLSKQVEFVNFSPLFLGFMIQACGDYNPSLNRFELTSFGQHPLARWPLVQKLVQLFAVVSYETEVEVKIKTPPGSLVSGEQLWSRIAAQVVPWSKSGEAKYLGDISVTLPAEPLHIQCADGSFKVQCPVDEGGASLSAAALAGIIIGGVALVGGAVAIWLFVIRPRLKSQTVNSTAVEPTTATPADAKLPVVPQSINIQISETKAKQAVELAQPNHSAESCAPPASSSTTSTEPANPLEGTTASASGTKRPSLPGVVHSRNSTT